MTLYTLEPDERTLHGFFSKDLEPVLTIDPGDTVRFRTLDAGWGLEPFRADGSERRTAVSQHGGPYGHALCGPVEIRGAEAGMTLAVRVDGIRVGPFGATFIGGPLAGGEKNVHVWELDAGEMTGRNQHGHTVGLRPFMGVMGMPPPEAGRHETIPPRVWGGNLDCKELVVGSTLYLPIPISGALFSTGDGHALQGDGEVSGTAIECPMEQVELTFELIDDMPLRTPRAKTPVGRLTLGLDEDLNVATLRAMEAMLDLMEEVYALPRPDALALASLVVDLRITQIANGVHGVHAVLPDEAF